MRISIVLCLLILSACQSKPSHLEYGAAPQVVDDHTPVGCTSRCPYEGSGQETSFNLHIGPGKQLQVDGQQVTVGEFLMYTRYWRMLRNVSVSIDAEDGVDQNRLWAAVFATIAARDDVRLHTYRPRNSNEKVEFDITLEQGLDEVMSEAPIVLGPFDLENRWYSCKFRMYGELYDPARAEEDARYTYESGVRALIEVHIAMGGYGFVGLTPGWAPPEGTAVVPEQLDTGGDAIEYFCTGKYLDGRHYTYASRFNRVMSELIDGVPAPLVELTKNGGIDFRSYYDNVLQNVYQTYQDSPSVLITPVLWQKERADGPMLYRINQEAGGVQVSQWISRDPVFGKKVEVADCEADARDSASYLQSCKPVLMGIRIQNASQDIDTHWLAKTIQHYACGSPFASRNWVRDATAGVEKAPTPSYVFAADCDDGWQVNELPGLAAIRVADSGDARLQRVLALYREIESLDYVQNWNPVHPEAGE